MHKLQDFNYKNKRVFLRVDINVPVSNGIILDDTRINKIIPTINYLINQGASSVIIASHFGRPKEKFDTNFSLEFLTPVLSSKLNKEVIFCSDLHKISNAPIILLENLRFHPGETKNDLEFAKQLANIADYYVNDAFSCSHRAHASIVGITNFLPSSAGLLLEEEIRNLNEHLTPPKAPMIAIIGGSKVSTKLDLLHSLINKVDHLVIGGAMANTFLKAQDYEIGNSLYEQDFIEQAKEILSHKDKIILPTDVVVAKNVTNISNQIVDIKNIPDDKMILDLGPETVAKIEKLLENSSSAVMNGPVGVFEHFPFSVATVTISRKIAKLTLEGKLISIAGGGDIVAALSQAGLTEQFTYISTAGGAFLEWLEGKKLPGLL